MADPTDTHTTASYTTKGSASSNDQPLVTPDKKRPANDILNTARTKGIKLPRKALNLPSVNPRTYDTGETIQDINAKAGISDKDYRRAQQLHKGKTKQSVLLKYRQRREARERTGESRKTTPATSSRITASLPEPGLLELYERDVQEEKDQANKREWHDST